MDKPGQQFVIRLRDGLWYSGMERGQILGVSYPVDAFHFKDQRAALEVVRTTYKFHGAYILPYDPPGSQPEAQ